MNRPQVWPVLLAYGVALVAATTGSIALVVAVGTHAAGGDTARIQAEASRFATSLSGLSLVSALNQAILLGVAVGAAWLLRGGVAAHLCVGATRGTPLGLAAATVGATGISLACSAALDLLATGQGATMGAISGALAGARPVGLALAVLALCVAPAVGEETFFRGLVQTRLRERWGAAPAIVVSAALFGLLHLDPIQGSVAFVVGLYLGVAAHRLGGVRASALAHGVNNAFFLALAAAGTGEASRAGAAAQLGAGLAICGASLAFLRSPRAVTASTPAS